MLPEPVRQRSMVNQQVQTVTWEKNSSLWQCAIPLLNTDDFNLLANGMVQNSAKFTVFNFFFFLVVVMVVEVVVVVIVVVVANCFSQWIWTDTLCLTVVLFQSHFESLAAQDGSSHLVLPGSTSPMFFDNRMSKQSCLIMLFISHFVFDPVSSHFASNTKFWQRQKTGKFTLGAGKENWIGNVKLVPPLNYTWQWVTFVSPSKHTELDKVS